MSDFGSMFERKVNAPLEKRFSASYWKTQVELAEERRQKFVQQAEESIKIYNGHRGIGIFKELQRRLNVWWYSINTLMPAYYSSTPKCEVILRKNSGGLLEQMSAVVLERNVQFQLDSEFDFDIVGANVALQFLLTGQGVLWARYMPKFETIFEEVALIPLQDGGYVLPDGKPFDGAPEAVQVVNGMAIAKLKVEVKTSEKAILDVVQYNDYMCNDARNESEIEWQSRRAYLSREQATDLFGADTANGFNFTSYPDDPKNKMAKDRDRFEGKAEMYEIWCEASGKVYWAHFKDGLEIVEEGPPPIKYEKFYPCTVIRQAVDPMSVVPVSDYTHCKDQILEVERLTTRIHAITQAIRPNAAYDKAMGDDIENLLVEDLVMVPIQNWPSYKSRGGLASGIEFMPIEPYVNALNVLQQARQAALGQLYETLKVSDLLRGTSDQYKTATANRLENQWSSLGLVVRQNMFTKFISDAIGKIGTIVATQFDPQRVMNIADADSLLMPLIGQTDQDPRMVLDGMKQSIMEFLSTNKDRSYRIQVASDSMVAIDQMKDKQEGTELIQATGAFFEQSKALIEQYPTLLPFTMQLMQYLMKRFKGGKELEGIYTKAMQDIGETVRAKEEAAKQPPPPDPKMLEMQGRLNIAQVEAQARLQTAQMESQDRQVKNQILIQEQQIKMQRDQLEAQLAVQKQQFEQYLKEQELMISQQEAQIKAQAVQVDVMKIQTQAQTDKDKHMIASEANRMSGIIEVQKLELESMRVRLSESEKLMEERRLKQEQDLERVRLAMEQISMAGQSIQAQVQKRAKKRVGKIIADGIGNPVGIEITDYDDEDNENGKRYGNVVNDEQGNPQMIEFNED